MSNNPQVALFTGTFDPPSLGHWEIIQRAVQLFDQLYIGVALGNVKATLGLSLGDRVDLLKALTLPLENVQVIEMPGLAVDCASECQAKYLVRGIRNASDFDYEDQMAAFNRQLTGVETVVFLASPQYSHISSTLIREIAAQGHRLKGFVPDVIEEAIFRKFSRQ